MSPIRLSAMVLIASTLTATAMASTMPDYYSVKAAISQLLPHTNQLTLTRFGYTTYRKLSDPGHPQCLVVAGCIVIDDCSGGDDYLPSSTPLRVQYYAEIAYMVLSYKQSLIELGYPANLWEPALIDFESHQLTLVNRRTMALGRFADWDNLNTRIVEQIKSYRTSHPGMRGLAFLGGCGGAEISVKILTSPPASQIFLIATFFYDLCRVQGISADNMTACDHWKEVNGSFEQISGLYHYYIKWSDGTTRRGMMDASDIMDQSHNGQYAIVLRKP